MLPHYRSPLRLNLIARFAHAGTHYSGTRILARNLDSKSPVTDYPNDTQETGFGLPKAD